MSVYELTVFGEPAPQGSKIASVTANGKIAMRESSNKVKPWRRAVAEAALLLQDDDWKPLDGALEIETIFYLTKPPTVRRPVPTVAPDLDKLERGLFDALTQANVWVDDSLVIRSVSTKLYAEVRAAGCELKIRHIDYVPLG